MMDDICMYQECQEYRDENHYEFCIILLKCNQNPRSSLFLCMCVNWPADP